MENILNMLNNLNPGVDFGQSNDFFSDNLLDSFDFMRLVAQIEELYGIEIDVEQIDENNFRNLESIKQVIMQSGGIVDAIV